MSWGLGKVTFVLPGLMAEVRAHTEKMMLEVDLGESSRGRGTDLGGKGLIVQQRNLYLPPSR